MPTDRENPYLVSSQESAGPSTRALAWRLVWYAARAAFNLAVVVIFTGFVGAAIWLFYNGYPLLVATFTLLSFMFAASFAGDTRLQKICMSLSVPILALGGYAGYQVYFMMFRFRWFESIFNSKGSGPLGLIIFVCGFAVASAFGAFWIVDRNLVPLRSKQSESPAEGAERTCGPEHSLGLTRFVLTSRADCR